MTLRDKQTQINTEKGTATNNNTLLNDKKKNLQVSVTANFWRESNKVEREFQDHGQFISWINRWSSTMDSCAELLPAGPEEAVCTHQSQHHSRPPAGSLPVNLTILASQHVFTSQHHLQLNWSKMSISKHFQLHFIFIYISKETIVSLTKTSHYFVQLLICNFCFHSAFSCIATVSLVNLLRLWFEVEAHDLLTLLNQFPSSNGT